MGVAYPATPVENFDFTPERSQFFSPIFLLFAQLGPDFYPMTE